MRKTKIICTIGPSSENIETLRKLASYGTDVIRLNFSHGDYEEHGRRIRMIKEVRQEMKKPLAILIDTKGPEIRIGDFENEGIVLEEGQTFILTTDEVLGNHERVSISYKDLPRYIRRDDPILLDDGLIELKAVEVQSSRNIVCRVLNGGRLGSRKGVNLPGVPVNLPAVTHKDIQDIKFGIANDIDFIAASFVRKPSDVLAIRKILEDENASHIHIIAKIENQEGVNQIDDILKVSDGIMVARGDLGVEIPTEDVPIIQKEIIRKCNMAGKPVITATQMLDSMIRNPRPTRAETNDVANAIYDGSDAIMLSGETAAGKYPVEALKTMAKIAERVENTIRYHENTSVSYASPSTITNAISHATCATAMELGAAAIITATTSGYTTRMVSKFRPSCAILATTTSERTYRKLSLVWGVFPYLAPKMMNTDEMIEQSVGIAVDSHIVKNGDLVVITAGVPVGVSGTTNLIKVHVIGDVLLKGKGIGNQPAFGRACVIHNAAEAHAKFMDGDILVAKRTDNSLLPFLKKSSGVITEEGGATSHAAVVGLTLEIPVIISAEEAVETLTDGLYITIDPVQGFVYNGKAKIL